MKANWNSHLRPELLRWRLHHGKERLQSVADLTSFDIVLTTYHTLVAEYRRHEREAQPAYAVHWHRVVLDEGKKVVGNV